jgi:hypothetical protein
MASIARSHNTNVRVLLNLRYNEHGVGNKGVILRCNDESGNGDGIEHMVCPSPVVVIGAIPITSVVSGVTIIKFTDRGDPIELG